MTKKNTHNSIQSIWRSGLLAFVFLCSLSINSQTVGQEYLTNPNINTTATSPTTGVDGSGGFSAAGGRAGWGPGTGGSYLASGGANGDCNSEDRMFKFNKKGGALGQYVSQVVTLPAGTYNWSFWTKWAVLVDYDTGDAEKPTFEILADDGTVLQTTVTTEPTTIQTWVEQTGTFVNGTQRQVTIKFHKYGGTNSAQTNLNQLMFVDDVSLNYASAETASEDDISLADLTQDGTTIANFTESKTTYDIDLAQGTTVVPTIAATTNNANASSVITDAVSIPGTTTIVITAQDGTTTSTVTINFSIPVLGVVGQEYLTNPNINTTATDANGVAGSGNMPANLGGWGTGANGSYAPTSAGNGNCHSEDRMFKFFKKNDAYVTQTVTLPAGIYSWSFWTKWGGLVNWDDVGDVKPKFTIMNDDDGDGTFTAVQTTDTTQPTAIETWVEQTGTYTNSTSKQVRIKFSKSGGTTAEPTNLQEVMSIDDVSLKFVGSNAWTGANSTNWDLATNWSDGAPDATSEVFIPGGLSDYPTASSAVTVSSLTMGSGASFIAQSTFAGTVNYNRSLGTANWYLVSSPVAGETYDNDYVTANGIASGSSTNRGIAQYTTNGDTWNYMQAGASAATFTDGTGYSVKRTFAGDISFTGTLNTNDAGVNVVLSNDGNRFNLLGNPYTSHIASATFLNGESAVSDTKTLWVWNQDTNAYTVKIVADAMVIEPSQGFFVKANPNGGTFNFAESNQVSIGGTFQRTDIRPEIYLTLSDQTDAREAKIYYIENMTTGFDVGYEGELFNGVSNPLAIFTHLVADSEGKNYQVQSLPSNNYENMVIPVGVNAVSGTAITISASTNNFPAGMNVYLEDNLNNSFTLLEAGSNFTTTLESNQNGIGRFYMHTTTSTLNASDFDLNNNLSIYTSTRDNLRIVGVQNGMAKVQFYNILGKEVLRTSFEGNGVNDISLPNLNIGVYIVKLTTEAGTTNKKIIIQ